MTPNTKLILGAVLVAVVNTLVAFLAPTYQSAALALAGVVFGALGIKRPGDVSPAQVAAASESTGIPVLAVTENKTVALK